VFGVALGPEVAHQLFAAESARAGEREQSEQRDAMPLRRRPDDGHAVVAGDRGISEEPERVHRAPLIRS
jgi:hypothetical protein